VGIAGRGASGNRSQFATGSALRLFGSPAAWQLALERAGIAEAAGLGPEDPIADVAAAIAIVGTIAFSSDTPPPPAAASPAAAGGKGCDNNGSNDCEKQQRLLEQGKQALLNWRFTGLSLPDRVSQAAEYNEQVRDLNLLIAFHNQKCPANEVNPLPTIPFSGKPN
jgi:hypothetical protein